MLNPKNIEYLQKRTIAQMLSAFGRSNNDAIFFEEVANISLSPHYDKIREDFDAYRRFLMTGRPHFRTKFQRLFIEIQQVTERKKESATADDFAEFCASVFVALNQQVNFNLSLYEFLQLFKMTIKH